MNYVMKNSKMESEHLSTQTIKCGKTQHITLNESSSCKPGRTAEMECGRVHRTGTGQRIFGVGRYGEHVSCWVRGILKLVLSTHASHMKLIHGSGHQTSIWGRKMQYTKILPVRHLKTYA